MNHTVYYIPITILFTILFVAIPKLMLMVYRDNRRWFYFIVCIAFPAAMIATYLVKPK